MDDDSYLFSDSANDSILKIIKDFLSKDGSELLTEKDASNTAELPDPEKFMQPPPETGNTASPETVGTRSHEDDQTVQEKVQTSEPR